MLRFAVARREQVLLADVEIAAHAPSFALTSNGLTNNAANIAWVSSVGVFLLLTSPQITKYRP
jgi:hypothetical protein